MNAWIKLMWDRPPESDAHRQGARDPYEQREIHETQQDLSSRELRCTDFVSRQAIGNPLASSRELLNRSQGLIEQSRNQILKCRLLLLMSNPFKSSIQ